MGGPALDFIKTGGILKKMTKSIIELVVHPHAWELTRARVDRAKVTNKELIENPYWFRNKETGQLYFNLYGCLGWPGEVTDKADDRPGYAAIVGIIRPKDAENTDPSKAKFQLLEEAESKSVSGLLKKCLVLREKYGFGIQEDLLRSWYGDPGRFLTTLSLVNERLTRQFGERAAIVLAPPNDFYEKKIPDNYVRDLRSVIVDKRFYFGYNDVLQNKLRSGVLKNDPAVLAMGGLVHTLLCETMWLKTIDGTAFTVDED